MPENDSPGWESEVNAAIGRAGIHNAITFAQAIDQIAAERDAATRLLAEAREQIAKPRSAETMIAEIPLERGRVVCVHYPADVTSLEAEKIGRVIKAAAQ